MQNKPLLSFVFFGLAVALVIWWVAAGHQMWTTTQHMVQVKDALFGTVTETWEKRFTPGLELIGPAAAVFTAIGIWLLTRRKKAA